MGAFFSRASSAAPRTITAAPKAEAAVRAAKAAAFPPMPVVPQASQVACWSSGGRLAVFGLDEMKSLAGGGRGIILMGLDDGEKLVQALAIAPAGVVLIGTGRGGKPQEERLAGSSLALHVGKRARRGRAPDTRLKITALRPALD